MHFLKFHKTRMEKHVRSRRPVVLWWFHFIQTTRVHLTMTWVVSFLISRPFDAPRRLLLFMRFEDPRKPISIYFNVPGALMKPCLAVYDTLRTLECPVTTVNLGLATGMGAFLCGAGTKGMRYALPNARFLMQRTGLDDPYQGQASDIGLMVRENLRDNDRMEKALVTMTGHPLEKIKKDMHRPASAIRGGRIVAGIAPKRYVHAGLATSTSAPTRPSSTA